MHNKYISWFLSIILDNADFTLGLVCAERGFCSPWISLSIGERKHAFYIPTPLIGNRNPLYQGKSVHIFPFPQGRSVSPNNQIVCCMKNQNNYPLYCRILPLYPPKNTRKILETVEITDLRGGVVSMKSSKLQIWLSRNPCGSHDANMTQRFPGLKIKHVLSVLQALQQ